MTTSVAAQLLEPSKGLVYLVHNTSCTGIVHSKLQCYLALSLMWHHYPSKSTGLGMGSQGPSRPNLGSILTERHFKRVLHWLPSEPPMESIKTEHAVSIWTPSSGWWVSGSRVQSRPCSRSFTTSIISPGKNQSIGVIPKCNQLGKWRLIINLPAVKCQQWIAKQLCSLLYSTVDNITTTVLVWPQ